MRRSGARAAALAGIVTVGVLAAGAIAALALQAAQRDDRTAVPVVPGGALTPPIGGVSAGREVAPRPAGPAAHGAPAGQPSTPRPGPAPLRAEPVRVGVAIDGILTPGASVPLTVRLTNPNGFVVQVRGLRAALDGASAGCRLADNFVVTVPKTSRRVAANATAVLAGAQGPRLRMRDLPVNQDACKGLQLSVVVTAIVQESR